MHCACAGEWLIDSPLHTQPSLLTFENRAGPFKYSLACRQDVKLCQQRALDRHCKREGFFPGSGVLTRQNSTVHLISAALSSDGGQQLPPAPRKQLCSWVPLEGSMLMNCFSSIHCPALPNESDSQHLWIGSSMSRCPIAAGAFVGGERDKILKQLLHFQNAYYNWRLYSHSEIEHYNVCLDTWISELINVTITLESWFIFQAIY